MTRPAAAPPPGTAPLRGACLGPSRLGPSRLPAAAAHDRQHPPAFGFLALVGLAVLLSIVSGCGREIAKAAKQADQAVVAIDAKAVEARAELSKPEPSLPAVAAHLESIHVLAGSAHTSLAPVITAAESVSIGDTTPDTTAEDASANPADFARRAAIQSGRAGIVAGRLATARAFGEAIAAQGSWAQTLLAGLGGAGGVGAIGLWLGRTIVGRYRSALRTTAQLADDLESAETDDQVDAAKAKALAAQLAAGNRPLVQDVRGKA